jgi:hypothetical protein
MLGPILKAPGRAVAIPSWVSTKWPNDSAMSYAGLQKQRNADPEPNTLIPVLLCHTVNANSMRWRNLGLLRFGIP